MVAFYLHGFASSARSKKAAYFSKRFNEHGVALRCPDFNEPEFSSLTMTRMLVRLRKEIERVGQGPIVLMGSSLGSVVALLTAAQVPGRIDRLVLLAPALMFARASDRFLGAERVEKWRSAGTLDVFHFAYGGFRRLNYAFYEDSQRYDVLSAPVAQPIRIFQGRRDQAVDYRLVEEYAATRPNVMLTLLDDDHQLMASLPYIWDETAAFLGLS